MRRNFTISHISRKKLSIETTNPAGSISLQKNATTTPTTTTPKNMEIVDLYALNGDTTVLLTLDNDHLIYTNLNSPPYDTTLVDMVTGITETAGFFSLRRAYAADAQEKILFNSMDKNYRDAVNTYIKEHSHK